jgi:hypothetical protein
LTEITSNPSYSSSAHILTIVTRTTEMSDLPGLGGFRDPNEKVFTAQKNTRYKATRLIVHGGVSIAIALRQDVRTRRLAFDYVVLDPSGSNQDSNTGCEDQPKTTSDHEDLIDSQGWTDSPLSLSFPKEVRVVGEEAVPNFQLPPVDKNEQNVASGTTESQLHPWFSSTLCLTANVPHFEIVSDGELQISLWKTKSTEA